MADGWQMDCEGMFVGTFYIIIYIIIFIEIVISEEIVFGTFRLRNLPSFGISILSAGPRAWELMEEDVGPAPRSP